MHTARDKARDERRIDAERLATALSLAVATGLMIIALCISKPANARLDQSTSTSVFGVSRVP